MRGSEPMKWASVISRERSPKFAVEEALEKVAGGLQDEQADLVLVFAYPNRVDQYPFVSEAIGDRFPGAALVGCSASGVVGGGQEVEHTPALSVTAAALPGVDVTAFHLHPNEIEVLGEEGLLWRQRPRRRL